MNITAIRQELALLDTVTPLEGQRYASCLHTYESASSQRRLILEWFKNHAGPQLPADQASVLSIGCGAGDLDLKILAVSKARAANVTYVGLEPDCRQVERFKSRMAAGNDPRVQIEAHRTFFEDFTDPRRFDLILMVHSLYYMGDPAQVLAKALGLLNETGRLVVLIASDDRLNELASSFWARDNSGSTWFSEDLRQHLTEQGIAFECQRIAARLDTTSCCEPGSEEGARIADFLAQAPTNELPPRLRQMIFSYLEATSCDDGGRRWLPHNVNAFTIERASANLG